MAATNRFTAEDGAAPRPPYGDLDGDGREAVIRFFDAMLVEGLDLDEVLRRTAVLAGCAVGVSAEVAGAHRGFDALGVPQTTVPDGASSRRLVSRGVVWSARHGDPVRLDETMLERLSIVCEVARRHALAPVAGEGFAALETALSPVADEVDRSRALRLLGIEPTAQVTVLAYDGPIADAADMLARLRETAAVRVAPVAAIHAVVVVGDLPEGVVVPRGARIGAGRRGAALDAATAWRQALTSLRYALPSAHGRPADSFVEAILVSYDDLGAFALIAEHLPVERIADNHDLAALDRLVAAPGGAEMRRTLETVAATGSIRQAAKQLHLHHNSVAHRVGRAEVELGFVINAPYGRPRLLLALVFQRLRDNVARLGPL